METIKKWFSSETQTVTSTEKLWLSAGFFLAGGVVGYMVGKPATA
jgi:hypothetical protein